MSVYINNYGCIILRKKTIGTTYVLKPCVGAMSY